eukprot:tig00000292_g23861.t1
MPRFVFVKKQVVQAPQYGVEPISLTVGRPQLNWVAVTNAVKYKVYRATSINGPWDLVATGSSSTGSDGKAPPTTYAQSLLYTHEGAMSNYILFQGIGGFSPQIEAYTTLTTATAQTYGDFIAGAAPRLRASRNPP